MQKIPAIFLFVFVPLLMVMLYMSGYASGRQAAIAQYDCSECYENYESGYYDGYSIGYAEGKEDGWDGAEWEVRNLLESAAGHARDMAGWSPEEAMWNIDIYRDGYDPDGFPIPTYQEYMDSLDTLYYFYQYLYSRSFD